MYHVFLTFIFWGYLTVDKKTSELVNVCQFKGLNLIFNGCSVSLKSWTFSSSWVECREKGILAQDMLSIDSV